MNDNNQTDPFVLRRYFALAVKNLRRRVVRTGLTVLGVALAVTVAVSLGGFMLGYRSAIDKSINMLGLRSRAQPILGRSPTTIWHASERGACGFFMQEQRE